MGQAITPSGLVVPDSVYPDGLRPPSFASQLTAASKRVEVADERAMRRARVGSVAWQNEAWAYFDEVEEVKFAALFKGAALSRLRLFPGFVVNPDEDPVPIAEAVEAGACPAEIAEQATLELERLGSIDQQQELLRAWGVVLTISGDSHLIGQEDPADPDEGDESWEVVAESAIVQNSDSPHGIAIRDEPMGRGVPVPEDAFVARVWTPHARWRKLADSNMRAVLGTCEELLIYSRQFRAVGKSRNPAGLLYVANELGDPPTSDGSPTRWEMEFIRSQTTPTLEDGAPSSIVPHIVRGPASFGTGQGRVAAKDALFHLPLDRKIDEKATERIAFLITRLAHGLDVPVEVLTGAADINHWTAWQIEDTTYKAHVEPLAKIPSNALTQSLLRPALREQFPVAPRDLLRRVVVGIDPSQLVSRPNKGQDAKDVFSVGGLSWEALRRHTGFPESDAPTLEELQLRAQLEGRTADPEAEAPAGPDDQQGEDQPIPDAEQPADGDEPEALPAAGAPRQLALPLSTEPSAAPGGIEDDSAVDPPARRALTAAAAGRIGQQLLSIDRELRERLIVSASDDVNNALRVVGNRLRGQAQGDPDAAAAVRGVAAEQVGAALLAAGVTLADLDQLAADQFDRLRTRWDTWTADAYARTAGVLATAAENDEQAQAADGVLRQDEDDDRGAGWLLLYGALVSTVVERVQRPDFEPPAEGEFDRLVSVQAGTVRDALARAGGILSPGTQPSGFAGELGPGSTVGGIATGPKSQAALAAVRMRVTSWVWNHGMPTTPYPPHQVLDGAEFADWGAQTMANSSAWPPFSGYFPGDHAGCTCDVAPIVTSIDQGA